MADDHLQRRADSLAAHVEALSLELLLEQRPAAVALEPDVPRAA
jgi:hypothetical protein